MERAPIRRYDPGIVLSGPARAAPPGSPRPGHGAVYASCDRHGAWSANWQDDFPEPDANGARYGSADFAGDGGYEAAEAWARAQPALHRFVAYPACALPGTPAELRLAYQPLPPEDDGA